MPQKQQPPALATRGDAGKSESPEGLQNTPASIADQLSNRLPDLAAQIQAAHLGVEAAARTAAEHAIAAGRLLIEGKALLRHGEWLPWLKTCGISERTAQLYMKIVRLGLKSETVADLGIKAASKVIAVVKDPSYHIWAGLGEAEIREWQLFALFGVHPAHIEWVRQREYRTPDEWMGPDGATFRRAYGMREFSPTVLVRWAEFREEHADRTLGEIEAMVAEIDWETPPRRKKRRAGAA